MSEMNVRNPFIVGKYLSDSYFCDRDKETEFLRKQIVNGRNVALISPRRIGKSGLIQHFFHQQDIQENYYLFFVDIYATTSLGEFVYTLGKEIFEQLKPLMKLALLILFPWTSTGMVMVLPVKELVIEISVLPTFTATSAPSWIRAMEESFTVRLLMG